MQPFQNADRVVVVLPRLDPTLGGHLALFELERAGFEAELGAPVEFSPTDPGRRLPLAAGDRSGTRLGTDHSWEPGDATITSRARDVAGIFEALNLWRTVRRSGGAAAATDCASLDEAIERIVVEVADTYPAFELRGLDWDAICERASDAVRSADDPLAAARHGSPSSRTRTRGSGRVTRISRTPSASSRTPSGSRTCRAGRPGTRPASGQAGGWRRSTTSSPTPPAGWSGRPRRRTRVPRSPAGGCWPGRRRAAALDRAGPSGTAGRGRRRRRRPARTGRQLAPAGLRHRLPADRRMARRRRRSDRRGASRAQRLRVARRRPAPQPGREPRRGLPDAGSFPPRRDDARLDPLQPRRGSALSRPTPLLAEPAARAWPGRLVVLTDELTFSSSEDFLLGLQGLAHVRVVGTPSGGGSGRPRHLRLLPGWPLTVSTALTYDRNGRCVEGAGIPVDVHVPPSLSETDAVLEAAAAL